jgi:AcrR family transcriptional regulator
MNDANERQSVRKGSGRKRSTQSQQAVLAATAALLKNNHVRELTIDAVSLKAGVSKATIYRWWPNKAFLALDACTTTLVQDLHVPDTGCAREDFSRQLRATIRLFKSPTGRLVRQFLAEGQTDEAFRKAFTQRFLGPRREAIRAIWERGVERGEISPQSNPEIVLDVIFGAAVLRTLTSHAPITGSDADEIIDSVFSGISIR